MQYRERTVTIYATGMTHFCDVPTLQQAPIVVEKLATADS